MGIAAVLVLAATVVCPALGQPAETAIVPGHSVGPITLGMPVREARAAAARFEHATGCDIDLLVAGGVVVAAGSSWGGCLDLQVPPDARPMVMFRLSFLPAPIGVGGPPDVLVDAFGAPSMVRQDVNGLVLIFSNGLAARVGAVVSYVAVQAAGLRSVPRFGDFANETERVHLHFNGASDAPQMLAKAEGRVGGAALQILVKPQLLTQESSSLHGLRLRALGLPN